MKTSSLAAVVLALAVKQVLGSTPIVGATGGVNGQTGERPARQEIGKFAASGPAFDLYILALAAFQAQDQWDTMGYFQLAGIHGKPDLSWDGTDRTTGISGFCEHGSVLFTTWHRPYLAAIEQSVWQQAQNIAQQYPSSNRDQYIAAAQNLRLPYWDWSTSPNLPDVVFFSAMTINGPNGQETIPNPLYQYQFHPYAQWEVGYADGLDNYDYTIRGTDGSVSAEMNVDAQLTQYGNMFHESAYNILTSAQSFAQMSSTGVNVNGNGYQSLENMHNIVHSTISGHMALTSTAAFDPIFWLHHANVDRIFSMWQAINPDSWVTDTRAPGTAWIQAGSTENSQTPLAPFHKDTNGNFFTSDDVRSTRLFGYTYPEISDWNVSPQQLSANVRAAVNQIYNPQGSAQGRAMKKMALPKHRRRGDSYNATESSPYSANAAAYQWAISYTADPTQLPKSLLLQFYWKGAATTAALNATQPHYYGNSTILGGKNATNVTVKDYSDIIGVGPIQVLKGTGQEIYNGQVPLTNAVLNVVPNGGYNATLAWIKDNLLWKGQWFDGTVMPTDQLPAGCINVTIIGRQVIQTTDVSTFPTYYNWTVHDQAPLGSQDNGNVVQPCNCAPVAGAETATLPVSAVAPAPTGYAAPPPTSAAGAASPTTPPSSVPTSGASLTGFSGAVMLLAAFAMVF